MELSQNTFDFAKLVLKHYDKKKPSSSETPSFNANEEILAQQKKDQQTKYSMDYKKFEDIGKEEESKKEDPFKTNPYLAQMGCSHDRRKVLQKQCFK